MLRGDDLWWEKSCFSSVALSQFFHDFSGKEYQYENIKNLRFALLIHSMLMPLCSSVSNEYSWWLYRLRSQGPQGEVRCEGRPAPPSRGDSDSFAESWNLKRGVDSSLHSAHSLVLLLLPKAAFLNVLSVAEADQSILVASSPISWQIALFSVLQNPCLSADE